jgi:DNA-directed RNA polymerase subunit K/omega
MKYFIGTTKTYRAEQLAAHEKLVEGWKDAIRAAEEKLDDQFPLHVSEDGTIQIKSDILKEDIPGYIVSAIERQYAEQSTKT